MSGNGISLEQAANDAFSQGKRLALKFRGLSLDEFSHAETTVYFQQENGAVTAFVPAGFSCVDKMVDKTLLYDPKEAMLGNKILEAREIRMPALTIDQASEWLMHAFGISNGEPPIPQEQTRRNQERQHRRKVKDIKESNEGFLTDLTASAQQGDSKLIGCEDIIESIFLILQRKYKANVVLVGHPGVGKTKVIIELARLIALGNVPLDFPITRILELDLMSLFAGAGHMGEPEQRFKKVLETVSGDGNLLFISVPGEEFMSLGMINSVGLIARLKEKFNLGYQILIDSEPHQREKDCNGVIYEGTAGKLLALVYVRGKKAHVGDVFAGFNPLLLLSEIVLQTELNTGFSDAVFGEVAPPPTWMFLRDRQSVYDGSLPMSAGGCLSIISLSSKPTDIVSQLTTIIENACRKIIKEIEAHYANYKEKNISAGEINPWEIKVKSFSDIYQMALNNSGQEFIDDYQQTFEDLRDQIQKNQKNIHESTFILIEKVLEHISISSPIVVLSFAPPYYPPLANYNYPSLTPPVSSLGDEIISFAHKELNEKYKKLNYFMQISDMSFASFHDFADAVTSIGSNMPFWDKYYGRISNEGTTLSMPIINIGPWGKDLHKFTERVYKPDLNERTYKILKYSIDHIL